MNRFYMFAHALLAPFIRFFFPMRTVGLENLPEGGALICPNHTSGWDPILVAIAMPRTAGMVFMGKEQLFRIPPLGWLFRKLGAFPVKRGGNDLTAMRFSLNSLREGKRLLMFPEGTRVDEQGEADAKGGVTLLSTRAGVPIIPVYCGGKRKFLRRTTVVFGEPYTPVIAGRRPTQEENRQVAEELLERIYALAEVDGWKK